MMSADWAFDATGTKRKKIVRTTAPMRQIMSVPPMLVRLEPELSLLQLVKQRLGLLQIARVKSYCEPPVDRSEKLASVILLALVAPEPRHAHRGARLQEAPARASGTSGLCCASAGA